MLNNVCKIIQYNNLQENETYITWNGISMSIHFVHEENEFKNIKLVSFL